MLGKGGLKIAIEVVVGIKEGNEEAIRLIREVCKGASSDDVAGLWVSGVP